MCEKKNCKKKKALKLNKPQLKKRLQFYETIHNIPNKQRCNIIPYLSNDATDLLCEAIYNTINVDLGLKGNKKKALVRELKNCGSKLNHICNKATPVEKRKQYLMQEGGFIGPLLGAIIPSIASLIGGLINKK